MSQKIKVGIVGATGYTGFELLRLLRLHPNVEITSLTSRQHEGQLVEALFPAFLGMNLPNFEALDVDVISKKVKAVFLCLPHHESIPVVKKFREKKIQTFDLSADFRLKDVQTYEKWYGPHSAPELLSEAVYGLPELNRKEIAKANLVAVPGCYPTSVILGLAPLVSQGLIKLDDIICDSKSGTSGAGRNPKTDTLFCEVNESFKAYSVGVHRHAPEMEQALSVVAKKEVKILFSPHLIPVDRGILSTIYVTPAKPVAAKDLREAISKFYEKESFVFLLKEGMLPSLKAVRGTNQCHLQVLFDEKTQKIVVLSAIDNLTKGASGQAVQCFNLANGYPETECLQGRGLF